MSSPLSPLIGNMNEWMLSETAHDTVVSTRARFARNLKTVFPQKADRATRRQMLEDILATMRQLESFRGGLFLKLEDLEAWQRRFLLERRLISLTAMNDPASKGLVVAADQRLSILVGEEDHLRLQSLLPSFELSQAHALADKLDAELEEHFEFAFSENFGYLTACPTNAGTGLRISTFLHLPALAFSGEMPRIFRGLAALNLSVRGIHGEGSGAMAALLQVSNARSLGFKEWDFVGELSQTIQRLSGLEGKARRKLLDGARSLLEDHVWKSFGLLKYARLLDEKAAMAHLGLLRLGFLTGILKGLSLREISKIWVLVQDGHIQAAAGMSLGSEEMESLRAEMLKEALPDCEPTLKDGANQL